MRNATDVRNKALQPKTKHDAQDERALRTAFNTWAKQHFNRAQRRAMIRSGAHHTALRANVGATTPDE